MQGQALLLVSPLPTRPPLWNLQLLKWMSLPLPSSPHGLSCLHAVPTLTLTHLLCHRVCGTVASPSSPVAQPTQGWSTPSCPQWTFFLCGLLSPFTPHSLASGLIHSVEQFPTPAPRSMDSVDSSVCGVEDSCCGWKPMPGTLLPGASWEHFSAPSRSLPWSLLSVEAGLFSLRGLIPAHAQD